MAVDPGNSEFWQAAIRSGLIDHESLVACLGGIVPDEFTSRAFDRRLARQAVETGKLTPWQARQILLGHWKILRIDKYALIDTIGRGGMGEVYLARDTRLSRPVAIKVLSSEQNKNPRSVARFEREARIAGQLQHEHLIRVYDYGDVLGLRYLVMEYIDGKSAARLIEEHGALPPAVAAELGRQVALGLEYLHRKSLLHRDVSPSNMLVDRSGTVKLADLGLAIDLDAGGRLTREGSTVGTFDYLSPEQARDSRNISMQSDLYSLGCSLYHMILGMVPFPAPSLPEKLVAHRLAEAEPLANLVPSCSLGLDAVIRRMMRKSPDERYDRPVDVARALEPFASGSAPLSRMMSMGETVKADTFPELDEAYAVEWFDRDPEADTDGPSDSIPAPTSPTSREIFPMVTVEVAPPHAPNDPSEVRASQDRRRSARAVLAFALQLVRGSFAGLARLFGRRR